MIYCKILHNRVQLVKFGLFHSLFLALKWFTPQKNLLICVKFGYNFSNCLQTSTFIRLDPEDGVFFQEIVFLTSYGIPDQWHLESRRVWFQSSLGQWTSEPSSMLHWTAMHFTIFTALDWTAFQSFTAPHWTLPCSAAVQVQRQMPALDKITAGGHT